MNELKLKLIKLLKSEDYGKVVIKEVIPVFHDRAKTSNKTILRLNKTLAAGKGAFINTYGANTTLVYHDQNFVSQNQMPIRIFDVKFNGIYDTSFKKSGYEAGQVYEFKGLGYLGNISETLMVKLVTDQYVVFEGENNDITLYSFSELDRLLKEML